MSRDYNLRITLPGGKSIELHGPANIVEESADAIVNAANSSLMGGGGVDGAIHDAGGPAILNECKHHVSQHGHLPAGKAMVTTGGLLKAKYVIHTVGPIYRDGNHGERELLASCYKNCIALADEHEIKSISFPAISTGAYGYPLSKAAEIALNTVLQALPGTRLERVRFVLFDHARLNAHSDAAEKALKLHPGLRLDRMLSSR